MVYLIYTLMTWKHCQDLSLILISFLVFLKLLSLVPDTPSLLPSVRLHRKFRPLKNPSWRIPNIYENNDIIFLNISLLVCSQMDPLHSTLVMAEAHHLDKLWHSLLASSGLPGSATFFHSSIPSPAGFVHLCSWQLWHSTVVLSSSWEQSCRAGAVRNPMGRCSCFSWELNHVLDKVSGLSYPAGTPVFLCLVMHIPAPSCDWPWTCLVILV